MYSDASHLDHLSQFCLTTPSFRREINETIVDANGYTDVVELVTNFLANLSDSHTEKMHQDEHNNTKWRNIYKNVILYTYFTENKILIT